jgi:CDP-4-dehydro-6-deoxyglucose reductase, E3
MPPKLFKAKLTKIVDLTPSVRELYIQPTDPSSFEFKAGQFVMLHLPDPEKPGKPAQRAYSVASAEQDKNMFKLVIKFYDLGLASNWVRTLKGGEEIIYTGPFGKFLFREPPAGQVVHVATSTGLAPLYSMMASRCRGMKDVDFKVFMGVWNEKEIFYKKELDELKKDIPRLDCHFVLDTPLDPNWNGPKGRVTEHIEKLDLSRPTEFYICGNPAMIKAVKEMLLAKNFPKEKIYTESYG